MTMEKYRVTVCFFLSSQSKNVRILVPCQETWNFHRLKTESLRRLKNHLYPPNSPNKPESEDIQIKYFETLSKDILYDNDLLGDVLDKKDILIARIEGESEEDYFSQQSDPFPNRSFGNAGSVISESIRSNSYYPHSYQLPDMIGYACQRPEMEFATPNKDLSAQPNYSIYPRSYHNFHPSEASDLMMNDYGYQQSDAFNNPRDYEIPFREPQHKHGYSRPTKNSFDAASNSDHMCNSRSSSAMSEEPRQTRSAIDTAPIFKSEYLHSKNEEYPQANSSFHDSGTTSEDMYTHDVSSDDTFPHIQPPDKFKQPFSDYSTTLTSSGNIVINNNDINNNINNNKNNNNNNNNMIDNTSDIMENNNDTIDVIGSDASDVEDSADKITNNTNNLATQHFRRGRHTSKILGYVSDPSLSDLTHHALNNKNLDESPKLSSKSHSERSTRPTLRIIKRSTSNSNVPIQEEEYFSYKIENTSSLSASDAAISTSARLDQSDTGVLTYDKITIDNTLDLPSNRSAPIHCSSTIPDAESNEADHPKPASMNTTGLSQPGVSEITRPVPAEAGRSDNPDSQALSEDTDGTNHVCRSNTTNVVETSHAEDNTNGYILEHFHEFTHSIVAREGATTGRVPQGVTPDSTGESTPTPVISDALIGQCTNNDAKIINKNTDIDSSIEINCPILPPKKQRFGQASEFPDSIFSETSYTNSYSLPNATQVINYTLPQPDATQVISYTLPQTDAAQVISYTLPQTDAAQVISYTLPQTDAAQVISYTLPQPDATQVISYTLPQPDATQIINCTNSQAEDAQVKSSRNIAFKEIAIDEPILGTDDHHSAADWVPPKLHNNEITFNIELEKGNSGLGFGIKSRETPADGLSYPHFVSSLKEGGPARKEGRMKVGDKILEVNGKAMTSLSHLKCLDFIRRQQGLVIVKLSRIDETVEHSSNADIDNTFSGHSSGNEQVVDLSISGQSDQLKYSNNASIPPHNINANQSTTHEVSFNITNTTPLNTLDSTTINTANNNINININNNNNNNKNNNDNNDNDNDNDNDNNNDNNSNNDDNNGNNNNNNNTNDSINEHDESKNLVSSLSDFSNGRMKRVSSGLSGAAQLLQAALTDVPIVTSRGKRVEPLEIPINDAGVTGFGVSVRGKTRLSNDVKAQEGGIFVKEVVPGGAADKDGRLKPNDQILSINGLVLVGKPNNEAIEILKQGMLSINTENPVFRLVVVKKRTLVQNRNQRKPRGSADRNRADYYTSNRRNTKPGRVGLPSNYQPVKLEDFPDTKVFSVMDTNDEFDHQQHARRSPTSAGYESLNTSEHVYEALDIRKQINRHNDESNLPVIDITKPHFSQSFSTDTDEFSIYAKPKRRQLSYGAVYTTPNNSRDSYSHEQIYTCPQPEKKKSHTQSIYEVPLMVMHQYKSGGLRKKKRRDPIYETVTDIFRRDSNASKSDQEADTPTNSSIRDYNHSIADYEASNLSIINTPNKQSYQNTPTIEDFLRPAHTFRTPSDAIYRSTPRSAPSPYGMRPQPHQPRSYSRHRLARTANANPLDLDMQISPSTEAPSHSQSKWYVNNYPHSPIASLETPPPPLPYKAELNTSKTNSHSQHDITLDSEADYTPVPITFERNAPCRNEMSEKHKFARDAKQFNTYHDRKIRIAEDKLGENNPNNEITKSDSHEDRRSLAQHPNTDLDTVLTTATTENDITAHPRPILSASVSIPAKNSIKDKSGKEKRQSFFSKFKKTKSSGYTKRGDFSQARDTPTPPLSDHLVDDEDLPYFLEGDSNANK